MRDLLRMRHRLALVLEGRVLRLRHRTRDCDKTGHRLGLFIIVRVDAGRWRWWCPHWAEVTVGIDFNFRTWLLEMNGIKIG